MGAPGSWEKVVCVTCSELGPAPREFTACTLNAYVVSSSSPVIRAGDEAKVVPCAVHALLPLVEYSTA